MKKKDSKKEQREAEEEHYKKLQENRKWKKPYKTESEEFLAEVIGPILCLIILLAAIWFFSGGYVSW